MWCRWCACWRSLRLRATRLHLAPASNATPKLLLLRTLTQSGLAHGLQVVRVLAIAAIEGNTFFARLHLAAAGGGELELDARPSDAINLAARTGAPLFVRRDVAGRVARHQ